MEGIGDNLSEEENVTMMVGHTYRHCEDRARILDSEFLAV